MNTDITKHAYEIMSGPSRDALFDACKYAYAKNAKIAINFSIADSYTMPKSHPGCAYIPMKLTDVVIANIEHEDDSGESFNLRGYCRIIRDDSLSSAYKFRAYYNTKTRNGTIGFYKLYT